MYLTFLGSAAFSVAESSFLGKIVLNPDALTKIFVPFLPNVKEDYYYHENLVGGQTFKRYRCRNCKKIFVISDCGKIDNHRAKNKKVNVGGTICECG